MGLPMTPYVLVRPRNPECAGVDADRAGLQSAASVRCLAVLAICALGVPAHAQPVLDARLELDRAYDRLLARPHPRYLLPAIENALAVGGGLAWYWIDRDRQVGDWDFPSLKQRLTFEAWRFDNNPFPINFAWHAYDGSQYHLFARSNDLGLLASIGYGVGTSLVWEFGVEFREKVSINDVIVTTGAGTVMGEAVHWLGRYLESAPSPRWWHSVARWTLATNRAVHNTLFDIDRLRANTTPDHLGFSSDIWHRFLVSTGIVHARMSGDLSPHDAGSQRPALVRLAASSDLAGIPGYLTAPELARGFASANISSASLQLELGDDAIGLDFVADAFLIGYHRQRLPAEGVGSATTIGVDLAYRYRRELFGPYVERLSQTHLPGLALDHHIRADSWWVRARVRANYDFVGVHARAYDAWREQQPSDILEKTILRRHGYYYGWGPSTRVDLELATQNVSVGGSFALARYASQEGYDRTQEMVTVDVPVDDRMIDTAAWLRIGSPHRRAYVEARLERHDVTSHVGDVGKDTTLSKFLISFGTEQ